MLDRSLPFLTAASPGGFRIFVLGFTGFFMAREDITYFSAEYTLASFFVMISGIGFATILMKSMAEKESFALFLNYAISSVFIGGGVSIFCLFLISYIVPVPDFYSVFVLIVVTSVYQVFRNYLVFKRSFLMLLVNDLLVGIFFVAVSLVLFLNFGHLDVADVLDLLSVSYSLALLMMISFMLIIKKVRLADGVGWVSKQSVISSLVVGLSNSASSGVGFILPSLFVSLGGGDVAIVASLAAAVFSAMSALPRGMINNNAASLSRMVLVREYSYQFIIKLKQKINRLVFVLVPLLSFLIIFYFYVIGTVSEFWMVIFFVCSFGFNVASGQLGVVESVLINFCGYERLSLYFNAAVFSLIMTLFFIVKYLPSAGELIFLVYFIPIFLGIVNILRMLWYQKLVKRFFQPC
ncbi:hypothetical protein [Vreelandella profundi]|uniref:hypothetical protein n=1 Tax=Vreelandella profundi TaxID=2852117 RepID=UPI001EF09A30|nr:hypothetical protein [Halomonas profundi]